MVIIIVEKKKITISVCSIYLSDMFEERALLLSRLGRHEVALAIYAHVLKEPFKAEEYVHVPTIQLEMISEIITQDFLVCVCGGGGGCQTNKRRVVDVREGVGFQELKSC